jgi:hypothetical protein
LKEQGIILRPWLQARLQCRVVDREPLPWVDQRVVVKAAGLIRVNALTELLQLVVGEVLAQYCTTCIAGTTHQPGVACIRMQQKSLLALALTQMNSRHVAHV